MEIITVNVALFASLRQYNPHGNSSEPFPMQLPGGSDIAYLLQKLQIPENESKQVFINSLRQEWDYVLQEGERVAIFPPIAGG